MSRLRWASAAIERSWVMMMMVRPRAWSSSRRPRTWAVGQADLFDHVVCECTALSFGDALVEEAEFDVVEDAAVSEEVKGLEHEADAVGAHC